MISQTQLRVQHPFHSLPSSQQTRAADARNFDNYTMWFSASPASANTGHSRVTCVFGMQSPLCALGGW